LFVTRRKFARAGGGGKGIPARKAPAGQDRGKVKRGGSKETVSKLC